MSAETDGAPPTRVDVWLWPLDVEAGERQGLQALLSDEERQRADRFVRPQDRDRWIVAHGRMRQHLGMAVCRPPAALAFSVGPHGRPALVEPRGGARAPSFNLSHAEGLGALAISFDAPVGVDVEAIRPMTDDEAAYVLSPAERTAIGRLAGQARLDAFFRFWTLKEAFIKALGLGLSQPLEDFDISPPGAGDPALARLAGSPDAPARWRLAEAAPAPGFLAAVAALTEGRDLHVAWHGPCSGAGAEALSESGPHAEVAAQGGRRPRDG